MIEVELYGGPCDGKRLTIEEPVPYILMPIGEEANYRAVLHVDEELSLSVPACWTARYHCTDRCPPKNPWVRVYEYAEES